MNRVRAVGDRRDAPARVLRWTARLLPAGRRNWGDAMQAELAGINAVDDRWRFARGCTLAIARRAALGSFGIAVGAVLVAVLLTARTHYLPLRIGLIAMVAVLGIVVLVGDRAPLFAPPLTSARSCAAVRYGAVLALGWVTIGIVLSFRSGDGSADRASSGVPILTALIALYLIAFLSLTSRALADSWVLTCGIGLGIAAALLWLILALVQPPMPVTTSSAFAVLSVAILTAAAAGTVRRAAALTALCAAVVGASSIVVLHLAAVTYGPGSWVPPNSAALTPAGRLVQSRAEAGDTYIGLVLVGACAAIAILATAIRHHGEPLPPSRRPTTTAPAR